MLDSYINLLVKGGGDINILSDYFNYNPSEVFVNGEKENEVKKIYYLRKDSNNITLIFNDEILSCQSMFYNLQNIIEIDLSNFDFSKVTDMNSMFLNCKNLKKIIFGKINTSSVITMAGLFAECNNLISIDLSNFDTSNVIYMNQMFSGCRKINSIDASSFNTSKVISMFDMFGYCNELKFVNVSSFDTSKVQNMQGIFFDCYKLTSIDLHNFDGSSVENFLNTFNYCFSLQFLNLDSFIISNNINVSQAFESHPSYTKYIVSDTKIKNFLLSKVNKTNNSYIPNNTIPNRCKEFSNEFIYDYNNICLKKCPNGTYQVEENIFICYDYIPENYYFNSSDGIYRECYEKCKKCIGWGNEINHNCELCNGNLIFINDTNILYKKNCYPSCQFNYYFDIDKNYHCTQNDSCPENYKLIKDKKKCIDECKNDDKYLFEYNNKCLIECPNGTLAPFDSFKCLYDNETNVNNFSRFKNLGEYIEKGYMDNIFKNISKNKEDYIEVYGNITYQLTTSDNQKNKTRNNLSSIDLLNCENILKDIYDINDSLSLNILKVEYRNEHLLIPIVGYEIYHPLNNSKLDLKYCNETIKLNIPVSIDENELFKYETNSEFYTDNCFSYTTDNGTDIILNDRKQEFIDNNLSLCENNCTYIKYDKNIKQSECDCYIKNEIDLIYDIIENPNKLSINFSSDENSLINSNLLTLKCTKE